MPPSHPFTADTDMPQDEQGSITEEPAERANAQTAEASSPRSRTAPKSQAGKARSQARKVTKRKPPTAIADKKKRTINRRPFPQFPLEDSLEIAKIIKQKNNGKPLEPEQVAKACGLSAKTTAFFYRAGSARDYGVTTAGRDSEFIGLTELGQRIVYPESPEKEHQAKVEAFFSVKLFKDVFEHYGGGSLPEKDYVSSVLFKKFGLDPSFHDEFCDIYLKNCLYLTLDQKGGPLHVVKQEGGGEAVVLGQSGQYARNAFIIMPFSEKGKEQRPVGFFAEVLGSLITPACNSADFGVQTAHSLGSDVIHHTIIRQLDEADLVIADLTDHNPNVLFELGIRIALDKPVLLVRAQGTAPIFDVDHMMRVCEYDPRLWSTTIDPDVQKMAEHIKGSWENRGKNPSYIKLLKTGQIAVPSTPAYVK